mgnify:FL=1
MIGRIHLKKHQNRVDYVKKRLGNLVFLEEEGEKESLPVVGTRSKILGMA